MPGVCGGSRTETFRRPRVKLLLDENVSDRIVQRIADLFPDSTHIKTVGLKEAEDRVVWEWARQHGFTAVGDLGR